MQKKKSIICSIISIFVVLSITGCANQKKNENLNSGMQLVEELAYEEALASFEQAILKQEDQELTYRGQALAYMGLTKYQEAVDSFLKAFSYCQGNVTDLEYDMNYYLATAYMKLEQFDQAEGVYQAILDMQPKAVDAWYLRGYVRLKQNRKDEAISDFEKAISLKPNDTDLVVDIYQTLKEAGYKDEGAVYLQNVIDSQGSKIQDFDLGKLSFYLEDYENARVHLDSALNSNDADAILLLGQTYEALGDLNYAVVVYSTYLDKNTANPELYNRLGVCKMKQGSYEDALQAFENALTIEPNSMVQTIKFNQIVANEYLGKFDTANSLMKDYLVNYPDDQSAKREAEFLKTR